MSLFIGVTTRNDIHAATVDCILKYMHDPLPNTRLDIVHGDGSIFRCRNQYTQRFLKDKQFTDLLNLDSDIVFEKYHIDRIMSHDADIVGGVYFKKQVARVAVLEGFPGPVPTGTPPDLLQVRFMGTGFLRVRRKVFEAMIEEYGDKIYYIDEATKERHWHFWPLDVEPESHRLLSEDWWFCHRANKLGFKVYADTKCVVEHMGTVAFPIK